MKWWLEYGQSKIRQNPQNGSGPFLRLGEVVSQILLAAGILAVASCSKISQPPAAQDGAAPAASPAAGQNMLSFLSSFDNPPAPANVAPSDSSTSPAAAPVAGPVQARTVALKVHPAKGAKEAAMKMYPQLAVKDSTFNKLFRDLHAEAMQQNPELLAKADWPLILAHRTADLLAHPTVPTGRQVAAMDTVSTQEMPQTRPTWATPTPPTSLSRPAYNQTRSPSWWGWPWVRYY